MPFTQLVKQLLKFLLRQNFFKNVSSYKSSGFPQHPYFDHINEIENMGKFRLGQMQSGIKISGIKPSPHESTGSPNLH